MYCDLSSVPYEFILLGALKIKDIDGDTALHWAVNGGPPVIRLLIGKGADPKAKNAEGQTPADVVWSIRIGRLGYTVEKRQESLKALGEPTTQPASQPDPPAQPGDSSDAVKPSNGQ